VLRDMGAERSIGRIIVSGEVERGYAPGMEMTSSRIRGRGEGVAFGLRREDVESVVWDDEGNGRLLWRFGIASGGTFGGVSAVLMGYGDGICCRVFLMGIITGGVAPFLCEEGG